MISLASSYKLNINYYKTTIKSILAKYFSKLFQLLASTRAGAPFRETGSPPKLAL
jgi:hypothetical protein